MCGIAGFLGAPDRPRLERMVAAMHHRGPDGRGMHESPWAQLGMARLAIVDLAGGDQPFVSQDGGVAMVCNGEIYNHRPLRRMLEERGVRFRSDHSDVEVILRLYELEGIRCLERLDGMFAVAIADHRAGVLHLARDRVGERPLYWRADGGVAFASEFNVLAADLPGGAPGRRDDVDGRSLRWFLGLKSMPDDATIDRRIHRLPAGCRLEIRRGQDGRPAAPPQVQRWWRLPALAADDAGALDDREAADRFEALLRASIERRLDADVEVGAFLSGGLDSSLAVAMAAARVGRPLRTYSLVYDEEIYRKSEDRRWARVMSERLGTRHTEVLLTPQGLQEALPRIAAAYGQPNSATLSAWFVSQRMHRDIKVAISGDGADELFGSYFLHRTAAAVGEAAGDPASPVLAALPEAERAFALQHLDGNVAAMVSRFAVFTPEEAEALLAPEAPPGLRFDRQVSACVDGLAARDPLGRMLEWDFTHTFVEQVLNYADVLGMAHAVEPRPPFLSPELVSFVFGLPARHRSRGGRTKLLLRLVAERHLPREIVERPKEGFVEPNVHWLAGPLREFANDVLGSADSDRLGLLRPGAARQVLRRFEESGDFRAGKQAWMLLQLGLWQLHRAAPLEAAALPPR